MLSNIGGNKISIYLSTIIYVNIFLFSMFPRGWSDLKLQTQCTGDILILTLCLLITETAFTIKLRLKVKKDIYFPFQVRFEKSSISGSNIFLIVYKNVPTFISVILSASIIRLLHLTLRNLHLQDLEKKMEHDIQYLIFFMNINEPFQNTIYTKMCSLLCILKHKYLCALVFYV